MTYFLARANQAEEAIERVLELAKTLSDAGDEAWVSSAHVAEAIIKAIDDKPSGHQLEHSDQVLRITHAPEVCEGQDCTIHNMSDHKMRSFKQLWRGDRALMERVCPHGVGHPDPDDPKSKDKYEAVHGCDGCCR